MPPSDVNKGMTFERLTAEIEALACVENVDVCVIGRSVLGRPICAYHVGQYDANQIIVTGAIHAREWITALLLAEFVKIYAACPPVCGGIYFVPLCNPDGVEIALGGNYPRLVSLHGETRRPLHPVKGNPLWKANARGVDLNVNFDADWGRGAANVRTAGPENYIGPYPNSEPETRALIDFTMEVNPRATVAYHSKGELVYYVSERDRCLAHRIACFTGYTPEKTQNSTGGYSDWVSMHLGVPALTIEVGNDDLPHPIGEERLGEILEQNKEVPGAVLAFCAK